MSATPAPGQSRFAAMARQPGGLAPEDAISRAETSLAAMAADYVHWVKRDLDALEAAVDGADLRDGRDDEAMAAIYRQASALRDLGATFDYPIATVVADKLCELTARLRHARSYAHESVHAHLAALRLVTTPAYRGRAPAEAGALLDGLSAVLAKHPPVPEDWRG